MPSHYDRLARCTGFQWDAGNETKNWEKHAVSQAECEQVFLNQPLIVSPDLRHSVSEDRFFALGRTDEHRLLLVVFTIRDDLVRVISARDMSHSERSRYSR